MPPIHPIPGGVRLTLHIQPRASRTELAGLHGNAIKLRLAAPPVDGAANAELVTFLADRLSVPQSAVEIRLGASGRRKTVNINGIDVVQATDRLQLGSG